MGAIVAMDYGKRIKDVRVTVAPVPYLTGVRNSDVNPAKA
jgi:hypothetical protein